MTTTIEKFPVCGSVALGFESVRAVFENNFIKHSEVGAPSGSYCRSRNLAIRARRRPSGIRV